MEATQGRGEGLTCRATYRAFIGREGKERNDLGSCWGKSSPKGGHLYEKAGIIQQKEKEESKALAGKNRWLGGGVAASRRS